MLGEQKQAKTGGKEKLCQPRTTLNKLEEELENSTQPCNMGEQLLWAKETIVGELQKPLNEEQKASAKVEEEFKQARTDRDKPDEKFKSEAHQHGLQIHEKTIWQEHCIQEEELDRRTTLEDERLRSSIINLEEERNQSVTTKRKVQSAISAAQEALPTELEREDLVHNFIIKDKELEEEKTTLQDVHTKVNEELSQRRSKGNEIGQTPQTITNKIFYRNTKKEDLSGKEGIAEELKKRLEEEKQSKIRVEEELRQQRGVCTGMEETIQDLIQMCVMLQSENDASKLHEEQSRNNDSTVRQLEEAFGDELQAQMRIQEELRKTRNSCTELKERLDDLVQVCGSLESESFAQNMRKQEVMENEIVVDELQETLSKVLQENVRLEEELSQARNSCAELKQKLENELARKRRTFENEICVHARELELRKMQEILDELKRNFEEEQEARVAVRDELNQTRFAYTELERRMENERLSSQSRLREQRLTCEQESQKKISLDIKLRNLERLMEGERNRFLSSERELQSAVSEAQHRQPHDWAIQREEVVLYANIVGSGAWGYVCEGRFRGCQVAVKQIHELILSPHNRRLFEREMSIASCCHHPNLLLFIGATNDDGSPLFITELLDTSLRHLLFQRSLNQEEIVSLALDVAKGLNYLHLVKPLPIIHRDVSSSNVLLWRRDECWRAKLSDYGAANFMRQYMTVQPGAVIYSAPEASTPQQSPKVNTSVSYF